MIEVKVPTTGNSGEPAVVLDWAVSVGQSVSAGDIVATLETAKAVVEVDAPADGVLLEIRYEEGDEAPEYDVLFVLGDSGEEVAPRATAAAEPADVATAPIRDQPEPETAAPGRRPRISISPRARRLAQSSGVDIHALEGSGPFGRILFSDVEAAAADAVGRAGNPADEAPAASTEEAAPQQASSAPSQPRSGRRVVVRGARKTTAQRMHASLQQSAQVTLTRYASAAAMLAYAQRLRASSDTRGTPRIGINDLLLFATARTVVRHPSANAWFDWDAITEFDHVDLGFAVDTDRALLVPVIRDAHALSLADLAASAHDAIDRARAGKTSPDELEGGTFTVSNLGGAGIHWFTPVLNTPQTCILGVGAVHQASPDAVPLLPLSLTFDHRGIDGSAAAALLADIVDAIENVDTLAAF